jgi:hypothetical protein
MVRLGNTQEEAARTDGPTRGSTFPRVDAFGAFRLRVIERILRKMAYPLRSEAGLSTFSDTRGVRAGRRHQTGPHLAGMGELGHRREQLTLARCLPSEDARR